MNTKIFLLLISGLTVAIRAEEPQDLIKKSIKDSIKDEIITCFVLGKKSPEQLSPERAKRCKTIFEFFLKKKILPVKEALEAVKEESEYCFEKHSKDFMDKEEHDKTFKNVFNAFIKDVLGYKVLVAERNLENRRTI